MRIIRQTSFLVNTLENVPENSRLTFKLLYNEEITPIDYEPPGFIPSKSADFYFDDEIKVGIY